MPTDRIRPGTASWGEAAFVVGLLAITGVCIWQTFLFRNVPWDPLGMAFWPRILLGGLTVALLAQLWFCLRGATEAEPGFRRGMGILGLCVGFVLGLPFLGIYLITPLFMAVFALLWREGTWARRLAISLAATVVVLGLVGLVFQYGLELRVMSTPARWR
jgi:hypothetical protein